MFQFILGVSDEWIEQALIRILMVEWAHQAFALHAVVCPPLARCISQTSNFLNRNKHYRLLYPRDLTLVGKREKFSCKKM